MEDVIYAHRELDIKLELEREAHKINQEQMET